jgi:hypothetical protein
MRLLFCSLVSLPLTLLSACSDETTAPRDAAVETAVDRGTIEGPITQPVVDAFVPLDGPTDTAPVGDAGPTDTAPVGDAGPG